MFARFACHLLVFVVGSRLLQRGVFATCPLGGSNDFCGIAPNGSISGPYGAACSCQSYFCCSPYGFCGPEPGVPETGSAQDYCGNPQPLYGAKSYPTAPTYFEYVGTGLALNSSVNDTLDSQSAISKIPLPRSGGFYFVIFLLTDQKQFGRFRGTFQPSGLYQGADGNWTSAVGYLTARAKSLASIAGATSTTQWDPSKVTDEAAYVRAANSSLLSFYQTYGLSGFNIGYGETISLYGQAEPKWLRLWCQIIFNIKQARPEAVVTFAPFVLTKQAYRDLQLCLSSQNPRVSVDFILFQALSEARDSVSLETQLEDLQIFYAPTKVVPTLSNNQIVRDPSIIPSIKELIVSGNISGAAVFDADRSLANTPPFIVESQLWG